MPEGQRAVGEIARPAPSAGPTPTRPRTDSPSNDTTPFVSRAVRATRESSSLRVTIPQVVATTLGLRPGDDLVWIVDPLTDQVHVAALRRDSPVAELEPPLPEEA